MGNEGHKKSIIISHNNSYIVYNFPLGLKCPQFWNWSEVPSAHGLHYVGCTVLHATLGLQRFELTKCTKCTLDACSELANV